MAKPRCEAITSTRQPCKLPAQAGGTRCWMPSHSALSGPQTQPKITPRNNTASEAQAAVPKFKPYASESVPVGASFGPQAQHKITPRNNTASTAQTSAPKFKLSNSKKTNAVPEDLTITAGSNRRSGYDITTGVPNAAPGDNDNALIAGFTSLSLTAAAENACAIQDLMHQNEVQCNQFNALKKMNEEQGRRIAALEEQAGVAGAKKKG
jgi:hypothetical protein